MLSAEMAAKPPLIRKAHGRSCMTKHGLSWHMQRGVMLGYECLLTMHNLPTSYGVEAVEQ